MADEQNSLDLLIALETAIGHLYERFAEVLPEHRTFWEGMTGEERKHADILQELSHKEPLKNWFMNNGRFKILAIASSIEYIERQLERVKKAGISMLEALSVANDLEEALIEKQFISLNISGPEEIRNVMKGLVADTQRHRKTIAEKLKFHKS